MSKPLIFEHGKSYLIGRCPKCGEVVDAIPDPGDARATDAEAIWEISCRECGSQSIDLNSVEPEVWK
jgi:predicted RNA-binding Zn-ribbon protein involved in translation (DUF1610 family)